MHLISESKILNFFQAQGNISAVFIRRKQSGNNNKYMSFQTGCGKIFFQNMLEFVNKKIGCSH